MMLSIAVLERINNTSQPSIFYFQILQTLIEIPYAELTNNQDTFLSEIDSIKFVLTNDVGDNISIRYALICLEGKFHDSSNAHISMPVSVQLAKTFNW